MTRPQRFALRVAAILAIVCGTVLAINGTDTITAQDDEMPFVILGALFLALYVTKPRRT